MKALLPVKRPNSAQALAGSNFFVCLKFSCLYLHSARQLQTTVEPHLATIASLSTELGLQVVSADLLLLGEDSECERQSDKRYGCDETQVQANGDSLGNSGSNLNPVLLHEVLIPSLLELDVVEGHGGDDHDGTVVEDSASSRLVYSELSSLLTLAQ